MRYIVYRTENNINKKFYYGVHDKDAYLHKWYLGSGTLLKRAIKKHGKDNFIRRTIMEFDNKSDAYTFEALMVDKDMVNRRDNYNACVGGVGGVGKLKREFTDEHREKISTNQWKRIPILYKGVEYPSLNACADANGIARQTFRRWRNQNKITLK